MASRDAASKMFARLFYGHVASNWGDLAINSGAVNLLSKANIDVSDSRTLLLHASDEYLRPATLSFAPLEAIEVYTANNRQAEIDRLVDYLEEPTKFAHDYEITPDTIVVLNGGEHIYEGSSDARNTVDLIWRTLPAIAAAEVGAHAIALPSTMGPFRSEFGLAVRDFLADSVSGSVREAASPSIAGAGIEAQWPLHLDSAFFSPSLSPTSEHFDPSGQLTLVARMEDFGLRSGTARSNFVRSKFTQTGYKSSRAYQLFYEIGERAILANREVVIIVQSRADRDLASALHSALANVKENARVSIEDPTDYSEFLNLLRNGNVVVTSRFHAAILALAQGVTSVGVFSETHGHKMPGLYQMLELDTGAVRLDDRRIEQVADEIDAATKLISARMTILDSLIKQKKVTMTDWLRKTATQRAPSVDTSRIRIAALAAIHRYASELNRQDDLTFIKGKLASLQALITRDSKQ